MLTQWSITQLEKTTSNDITKFAGKWMELGKKNILNEVTQSQKDKHHMYSLVSGYYVQSKG